MRKPKGYKTKIMRPEVTDETITSLTKEVNELLAKIKAVVEEDKEENEKETVS